MVDDILVEKYRPDTVKEVVGQKHIRQDLEKFVDRKNIPHLLFYGMAGIGKTTSAIALGKDLLGDTFNVNFLELNASDERGINTVRDKVKFFARSVPVQVKFRIILLDECDALTPDAQNALRRIMEKYMKTCRFILCCNTIGKVISPLISRCATYNFLPLQVEDISERLGFICSKESITTDAQSLKYIAESVDGDIRRAIVRLQSVASNGTVNMENIYNDKIEGSFLFIVKSLFQDKNWLASRQGVQQYRNEGCEIRELILRLHNYVIRSNIVPIGTIGGIIRLFREAERDLILGLYPQIAVDVMLFEIITLLSPK